MKYNKRCYIISLPKLFNYAPPEIGLSYWGHWTRGMCDKKVEKKNQKSYRFRTGSPYNT